MKSRNVFTWSYIFASMCGRLGTCETKGIDILLLQAYWRSIHFDHTASVKHLKSYNVGTVAPLIWQLRIRERGPAPSPLILDQNEARRAEKNFLGDSPPPPTPHLSKGLGDRLLICWLIFKKPQPNLYSGDTCVGPTGEERFRCICVSIHATKFWVCRTILVLPLPRSKTAIQ